MHRIDTLHADHPFAGSRMLRSLLQRQGHSVGRRRVRTLMQRMGVREKAMCEIDACGISAPVVVMLSMMAFTGTGAAASFSFAVALYQEERRWRRNAISAPGVVIGNIEIQSDTSNWYSPVVRYQVPNAEVLEQSIDAQPQPLQLGTEVKVWWEPDFPEVVKMREEDPYILVFAGICLSISAFWLGSFLHYFDWDIQVVGAVMGFFALGLGLSRRLLLRVKRRSSTKNKRRLRR